MSAVSLPDEPTLIQYLALLRAVLLETRMAASLGDSKLAAELMDAVENVPDLLARFPDFREDWVWKQLDQLADRSPTLGVRLDRVRRGDYQGLLHPMTSSPTNE